MIKLTDTQIRNHWINSLLGDAPHSEELIAKSFDAWLAEHDRKVMEKAWDAGRASMFMDINHGLKTSNPHRKQEEE